MNKYEQKLLEVVPANTTIHELLRRPVRSPLLQLVDLMLENILWVADGLSSKSAYYLVSDEVKADLVHIEQDLTVSHEDVTGIVPDAALKKSFDFEGNRYKFLRKIR